VTPLTTYTTASASLVRLGKFRLLDPMMCQIAFAITFIAQKTALATHAQKGQIIVQHWAFVFASQAMLWKDQLIM